MFLVPEYLSQGLGKQHKQQKLYRSILFLLGKGRQEKNMRTQQYHWQLSAAFAQDVLNFITKSWFLSFLCQKDSSNSFLGNSKIQKDNHRTMNVFIFQFIWDQGRYFLEPTDEIFLSTTTQRWQRDFFCNVFLSLKVTPLSQENVLTSLS